PRPPAPGLRRYVGRSRSGVLRLVALAHRPPCGLPPSRPPVGGGPALSPRAIRCPRRSLSLGLPLAGSSIRPRLLASRLPSGVPLHLPPAWRHWPLGPGHLRGVV